MDAPSREGYGILWDNYAVSHVNEPDPATDEVHLGDPPPSFNDSTPTFASAEYVAAHDGDHHFLVSTCNTDGPSSASYASPYEWPPSRWSPKVRVTLWDKAAWEERVAVDWEGLTNMPCSVGGRVRGLIAGRSYTVALELRTATADQPANAAREGSATGGEETLSSASQTVRLFVRAPSPVWQLSSELGLLVDYYFVVGAGRGGRGGGKGTSAMDGAVAGYRRLTGAAPLYPRWAFGFWQCKEHYASQKEVQDAAAEFRRRKIPLDVIVQDWKYWGREGWGPHWDHRRYPDPAGMVDNLRAVDVRFMISMWSKFDKNTVFFKDLAKHGELLPQTAESARGWVDPWDQRARSRIFSFAKEAFFDIGVDATWMDATEPEAFVHVTPFSSRTNTSIHSVHPQTAGMGGDESRRGASTAALFNTYSLMTSRSIAEGLRRDFPASQGRRVFTLTRSAFAGQQSTGAALWSGDLTASWDNLRRQVASSLNLQASGVPYWSEDIGGFFRPAAQYEDPSYHLLLVRWFQFGAFTPIFRTHGSASDTELWHFGEETMDDVVESAIYPRYRLLPYTYSGFHRVEAEGWTMQRMLAFDWPLDNIARHIADQFTFGSALMVAPMIDGGGDREVYLPAVPGGWHGFYDGERWGREGTAGVSIRAKAPRREIPLFVRAGAVLPLGPRKQWTGEKVYPSPTVMRHHHDYRRTVGQHSENWELRAANYDAVEVRAYPGADGVFDFYDDDGVSAAGPSRASLTIRLTWNDTMRTMTFGRAEIVTPVGGDDPADHPRVDRTFNLVCVQPGSGHGTGWDVTSDAEVDVEVLYSGEEMEVPCDVDPSRWDA